MKTCIKNLFLLPALIAGLGLIPAGRVAAQTFTTMHSFTAASGFLGLNGTNSEGDYPIAGLILSGNTLYGTAYRGGSSSNGTVFAVHTDGTGITNLYSFAVTRINSSDVYTNSEGSHPSAALILSGNRLYGAAYYGGTNGAGTVFALNTNGTGITTLHSFTLGSGSYPNITNSDGANPEAGLILSGKTLYGTANQGGTNGSGTVFAVNTNGTGFTNLHNFTGSDGRAPVAELILSGNTLYGTAYQGGSSGNGTVFAVNTNGTGFTNLHSFTATSTNSSGVYTNSDGANPQAGLLLSGNTLYGTAYQGGSSGVGTLFAVNTNGTGFTNLHNFTDRGDGAYPIGGLILSGNTLYGTALSGGSSSNGTVFAVNTNGTGFTSLHSFTALSSSLPHTNSDGAGPEDVDRLILSGNILYGTAGFGGSSGNGTVFSINLALNIKTNGLAVSKLSNGMAQLTYLGTPGSKFALDWAHKFASPTVWTPLVTNTTTPDGYLIFTNTPSGTNDFYRIRSVP